MPYGRNGLIHSLQGNESAVDSDNYHPGAQHRGFKPTEHTKIVANRMG